MDLTKWPRLLVVGDPIAERQASEVILRTTDWSYLFCNDTAWTRAVAQVAGLQLDGRDHPIRESLNALRQRVGFLDLDYLKNQRVVSTWIGGPHGWCDWDGRVGADTYNIGKWPDADTVTREWRLIASAFPFLRLRAQLVTHEGTGEPAVEWALADGHVDQREPDGLLTRPRDIPERDVLAALSLGGGRGVGLTRLAAAFDHLTASQHATASKES